MDETIDILNDFMEPDDGGDGVDEGAMGLDQCFDDLFTETESELYLGCIKFSALNFLVKLMYLKVSNKWTNKFFDSLLTLLKDALPEGKMLPISHYDAKKKMTKLGLGYELIHVHKYTVPYFGKNTRIKMYVQFVV